MNPRDDQNLLSQTTFQAGLIQSRAYRALNNAMSDWLSVFGINLTEWALIGLLMARPEQHPSDLATALNVSAPMGTKILIKLEDRKLLRRQQADDDKRSVYVSLTAKGKTFANEIEAVVRHNMHGYLEGISREQLQGYLAVLGFLANKPQ